MISIANDRKVKANEIAAGRVVPPFDTFMCRDVSSHGNATAYSTYVSNVQRLNKGIRKEKYSQRQAMVSLEFVERKHKTHCIL